MQFDKSAQQSNCFIRASGLGSGLTKQEPYSILCTLCQLAFPWAFRSSFSVFVIEIFQNVFLKGNKVVLVQLVVNIIVEAGIALVFELVFYVDL